MFRAPNPNLGQHRKNARVVHCPFNSLRTNVGDHQAIPLPADLARRGSTFGGRQCESSLADGSGVGYNIQGFCRETWQTLYRESLEHATMRHSIDTLHMLTWPGRLCRGVL